MDSTLIRQQIPVCQNLTYLNTGWSGPSPLSVVNGIKTRLDYEMEQGPMTPDVQQSGLEIREQTRVAVANLINADPSEVVITKNTTDGLNHVMNGLTWNDGDEIITCNLEHGSVLIPSHFQNLRHGVNITVLDFDTNEPSGSIVEKIQNAITDRTRLVFLSHIQYSTGLRMPVNEIRRITKDAGVMLLLDGAQTAGHIKLDMKDIDCEFYSIPGQKWLLGPEATGALYIRQDMIQHVSPTQVAGKAVVPDHNPYKIQTIPDNIDKFQVTSTNVALHAGLLEAVKFVEDIGLEEIENRNLDLANSLKEGLVKINGVKVLSPMTRDNSSGLVSFTLDGWVPSEAVANIWENHRIVCRQVAFPVCIRASMHFFNTEEEVDQLLTAVSGLSK
ncbi:MAG: aminotransferase class V-fold PLP-dependent enzyme [Chloroflexota bacterium]|nr:aminotransferase class V-fold PLP-dependent enzyme [Chloroflexota bacterium]